ncbi:MAG: hypothetical protein ACLP8B_07790 [Xanthobacteraceae bacterium]
MGWFRKHQPDSWDTPDTRPAGDIEAARQVRAICAAAVTCASKLARIGPIDHREADRYQAARQRAIGLAQDIGDALLHDAAMRDILGLCMKANDVETAALLAHDIRTDLIRKAVAKEHPYFGGSAGSREIPPPRH